MKDKIKILIVFIVMFFSSYIPESNHDLFGDWWCNGTYKSLDQSGKSLYADCQYISSVSRHSPTWHWGFRHWLWLSAGIIFSSWTVIDMIMERTKRLD